MEISNEQPVATVQKTSEPDIRIYQEIVDRAHTEIEGVRNVYQWLTGITTVIGVTIVSLGSFFFFNTIKDMKSEMRTELEIIKKQIENKSDLFINELNAQLKNETNRVEAEVEKRINEEFDKENIHKVVESVAKTRIEEFARPFIEEQVVNKITPISTKIEEQRIKANNEIEKTASELDKLMINTQKELTTIEKHSQFLKIVINAQSGDRKAWDALFSIANDDKSEFNEEAGMAYDYIKDFYSQPPAVLGVPPSFPWKNGIDPSKLGINQLKDIYFKTDIYNYRLSLIAY
jgi:hypothetical protein